MWKTFSIVEAWGMVCLIVSMACQVCERRAQIERLQAEVQRLRGIASTKQRSNRTTTE